MFRDYGGTPSIIGLRSAESSSFCFSSLDGIARDLQQVSLRFRVSARICRTLLRYMSSNVLFEVWLGSPGRWVELTTHHIRHLHIISDDDSLRCLMQLQFDGNPAVHAADEVPISRFSYRERDDQPLLLRGVYLGDELVEPDSTILSYVQDIDRTLQLLFRDKHVADVTTDSVRRLEAADGRVTIFASHEVDETYTNTRIITIRPTRFVSRQGLVPPHRLICYDAAKAYRTVEVPTRRVYVDEDVSSDCDDIIPQILQRRRRPSVPSAEGWEW